MKQIVYIFLSFLFFAASCGKENSTKILVKPENLIEKQKMIEVLVDFHLAEAAIKKESRSKSKFYSNLYYYSLFKKHTISADDFRASVGYYIQIPEDFDAMYADVIEELEKLHTEVSVQESTKNEINKITDEEKKKLEEEKGSSFINKMREKVLEKNKDKNQDKKEGQ